MFDWIKNINKESPDFWKNYLQTFSKKNDRTVALSLETSGLDPETDRILSIAAFAITNNAVTLKDSIEIANIQADIDDNDSELNANKSQVTSEKKAIEDLIIYIENAVLVGHHIDFDIDIINASLAKMGCGRLKNVALDVNIMYNKFADNNDKSLALPELAKQFQLEQSNRHAAIEDAYNIALLFLKLKKRVGLD